ncbi:MAG: hypothetical protein HDP28_00380 [Clostridia bacterium]|nr:hypothetical protein [Clostridia bacterium]
MKKRFLTSISVVIGALTLLCGCALYGNDRSRTDYVYTYETDGKIIFYGVESVYGGDRLVFDKDAGTLALEESAEEVCFADPAVLDGKTFPRNSFEAIEGYEGLTEKLLEFDDKKDAPCVQAYALKAEDDTAYGFCNVYTSSTGFLSGGGQVDVKKIDRSILFTYSPVTNELTVLDEIKKGCVVAFNQTRCIYFYDRSYYSKEIGKEDAVKLCEDGAYDTGSTHYSYANFYFNGDYCIFKFHRGYNNYKKDYDNFLLFTMNGKKLAELHVPSNFK